MRIADNDFTDEVRPRRQPMAAALAAIAQLEKEARNVAAESESWRRSGGTDRRVGPSQSDVNYFLKLAEKQRQNGDADGAIRTLRSAIRINRWSPLTTRERNLTAIWLALAEAQLEAQNWK